MLLHGNTTVRQRESPRWARGTVQVHHPYKGPWFQTRVRQERLHSQLCRPEHEESEHGECMFRLCSAKQRCDEPKERLTMDGCHTG